MFCPKCGAQLNDDAAFCNSCGAKMGVEAPQQPQQPRYQQQPQYQQPAYAAPVKPKNPNGGFMKSKRIGMDDKRFAFAVLAAILALLASFLIHTSLITVENEINSNESYSEEYTISSLDTQLGYKDFRTSFNSYTTSAKDAYDGTLSLGALFATIMTVFSLAGVAYLVLPFIINKVMKVNVFNYIAIAALAFTNLIIALVSVFGICADLETAEKLSGNFDFSCGFSLGMWVFLFCALGALGILAWQIVMFFVQKD